MHILYIHAYFCPPEGGGNTRSLDFARAWVAAGHRVTILTSPALFPKDQVKQTKTWQFQVQEGLDVHVLNVPYGHKMGFYRRVRAFLAFYGQAMRYQSNLPKPDIIYASSTPPSVGEIGRKYARNWGIPFIFETVDVWPDVPEGMGILKNGLVLSWLHRRVNRIYAASAAIVALSEGMKAQVASHAVPSDKIHVVPNGTDPKQFPLVNRPRPDQVRCIYSGTVGKANDVRFVVRAAKWIQDKYGPEFLQIWIVGDGNEMAEVKELAHTLAVQNVVFKPPVPKKDVPALLAAADIGLVTFANYPVLEANSANKWFDYLSSGLPVVSNYEGWQAAYLRQYDCGVPCKQGDLTAFAEAIVSLAESHERRVAMGLRGAAMVQKLFDRNQLAGQVLSLMETVLHPPKSK